MNDIVKDIAVFLDRIKSLNDESIIVPKAGTKAALPVSSVHPIWAI